MKSPIAQFALPMILGSAMPALGATGGLGSLFGGMNPMMANALKQSALGYGTAALTGSKHPGKAAMYAGLTSLPFSYMSASNQAANFNKDYAGLQGNRMVPGTGIKAASPFMDGPGGLEQSMGIGTYNPGVKGIPAQYENFGKKIPKLSAFDVLKGKGSNLTSPGRFSTNKGKLLGTDQYSGAANYAPDTTTFREGMDISIDNPGDIFTKEKTLGGNIFGSGGVRTGEIGTNFMPTMASQAAAMYGGRMTPEEEWEASKSKRRKELAFMYGIDPSQVKGELQNPYYNGGGYFNQGGIASMNYDKGGPVNGPGGPKEDKIPAMLSDGEFVMTAKAVENLGGGDRYAGARKMYEMMNQLDGDSETITETIQEKI